MPAFDLRLLLPMYNSGSLVLLDDYPGLNGVVVRHSLRCAGPGEIIFVERHHSYFEIFVLV